MKAQPELVLFTRLPVPGKCKTRLIPALGPEGAADLHRALTERTIRVLREAEAPLVVAITGGERTRFAQWLGHDVTFAKQAEGDLTARLLPFVTRAPVILFGADTPDLSTAIVREAIAGLADHRVVIGPAADGGYYLIAMREPLPVLFTDMPWSTPQVLPETLRRCEALGISPLLLETLADCDRPEDLGRWPHLGR
ncbi:MAG: TIGR04282 family arsenosugar biosynthesis glycosyltransferase [Erythrobacter sp.]|jgi:rSAM/selenodomain-associated transferase 1|nr:TIGR04282 family arsenosugar biosynthesis glycosyltransferase [Erythrobacter sp.]